MKAFIRLTCLTLCLFVSQVSAIIVEAPTLDVFKAAAALSDKDTLVMFDVDDTLYYTEDLILRQCNRPIAEKIMAKTIKNPEIVPAHKYPKDYLKSQVLVNVDIALVNENVVALIQELKQRQIKTIAFTKFQYGQIGIIPSIAHWRLKQFEKFGIDFGHPFEEFKTQEIVGGGIDALYINGILFANTFDKGPVLIEFLKQLSWKPKKIIFLDDHMGYLLTVEESMKNSDIEFIGYHYTEMADRPSECDEVMAEAQYMHLALFGVWLSDKEYKKQKGI